mmetsp:Transcript_16163/g.15883  ORF Transcript_16163/g.15883 Transcript_16163/m.15883 type:complete len:105 (-) Transcript_16163:454-768(-)
MVILVTIIWIMTALWFILEAVVGVRFPNIINTFLLVGYFKTIITFAKYLPQVSLNYRRKSTKGLKRPRMRVDQEKSNGSKGLQEEGKILILKRMSLKRIRFKLL